MRISTTIMLLGVVVLCLAVAGEAQTRRKTKAATKKPAAAAPVATPSPAAADPVVDVIKLEPKKNERPSANGAPAVSMGGAAAKTANELTYSYEFAQPNFEISKIVIRHDDAGRGTITFTRRMFSETETDPLQVSRAALERINAAYTVLNFVDSNENYQYEKDYSHLGTMTFSLKRAGKQRTTVFNYTTNKDARALADEYRKLGNQFIWIFDITVARENQPLESPRLLDALDGLMRRNEISDPEQMLPLLRDLSNDERIPLIARNHAGKLADKIEKKK
ncbi:MAG TPA: hypothetical protein VFZ49_04570 [Pyrinomonadaceae bacterium]